MHTKLLFQLSCFGIFMGIGSVFFLPTQSEPFIWLLIFMVCAYFIGKKCREELFLHGMMIGLLQGIVQTLFHILFYHTYSTSHLDETALINQFGMSESPRSMMIILGLIFGMVGGIIIGIFSLVSKRLLQKNN